MHFVETIVKIKVYYLLVSNKLSSIEAFSFMALCLWCVRESGLLLSYPVPRLNSNLHFGKRLARMSARTQTEERLLYDSKIQINCIR